MRTKVAVIAFFAAILAAVFILFAVAPEKSSRIVPVKESVELNVVLPKVGDKAKKGGFIPDKKPFAVEPVFDPITGAFPFKTAFQIESIRRILEAKLAVAKLIESIVKAEEKAGVDVDCVISSGGDLEKCKGFRGNTVNVSPPPPPEELFGKLSPIPEEKQKSALEEAVSAVDVLGVVRGKVSEVIVSVNGRILYLKPGQRFMVNGVLIRPVKILKKGMAVLRFEHGGEVLEKTYRM